MKGPTKLIVLILAVLAAVIALRWSGQKGLSADEASKKAIEHINKNFVSGQNQASLVSVSDEGRVYKLRLKINAQEYDSYITKDGKYLFPEGINLAASSVSPTPQPSKPVPKSDKPDVKLFVMSYCPFGLQAEKMFLPVYNLLKDKAQMGIYYVNYIMHEKKELDENLRQYCLEGEQKDKYYTYLACFVKDGNSASCLTQAKVDQKALAACVAATDKKFNITKQYNDKSTWLSGQFPKFDIHTALNEKYGVRGSPSIVINEQMVDVSPRTPEKFKEVICQAFSNPPAECSQKISEEAPAAGFGTQTSNSTTNSQCQ